MTGRSSLQRLVNITNCSYCLLSGVTDSRVNKQSHGKGFERNVILRENHGWKLASVIVDFIFIISFNSNQASRKAQTGISFVVQTHFWFKRKYCHITSGHVRQRNPINSVSVFWDGNRAFHAVASMCAGSLS